MKRKVIAIMAVFALIAVSFAVVGCSSGSNDDASGTGDTTGGDTVEATGGEINLMNGGSVAYEDNTMVVAIEENPSTGYTWIVDIDNEKVITKTGDETIAPEASSGETGVPGMRELTFTAKSSGDAVINFELGQDWDGGELAEGETFDLKVTVDDDGNIAEVVES